jgi:NADH:ubiquinone oxidoreductase subunit 5 (subunit L)/multisubunit Na+/H+ antiporter MnhA subunit
MEPNIPVGIKPDRKIWFSMWFLAAIASFGVAFFPFFYYSIQRRNEHFLKEQDFEQRVARFYNKEWKSMPVRERNTKLWAASVILIVPVFVIAYFLSKDLNEHERHHHDFLATFYPQRETAFQWISIKTCAIITVATLGVGVVYWLYKIVNVYNNHFKEQFHIQYELLQLMGTQKHV